ncbi:MAG TPA: DUF1080 domain-containing protein [Cyclobacteriaceae bacterium]|nr:DUF1080 domain-containing protein [Cyclobacteriaceae bacterium]
MKKLIPGALLILIATVGIAQTKSVSKSSVILSAIKGMASRLDTTLIMAPNTKAKPQDIRLSGKDAGFFKVTLSAPNRSNKKDPLQLIVVFMPVETFVGLAKASVSLKGTDVTISLTGLSTKGLEGENEAPLAQIVQALGYVIDLGWTTLPNNTLPALQGEELAPALFRKAGSGSVEMIPVARYSPDFALNFGYYTNTRTGPFHHQAGILAEADRYPQHQMLFPDIASGQTSFDPGNESFGFYAISPTHTVYSEDVWNMLLQPKHVSHAVRIFPVKDNNGASISNSYLVCMEEASNGDYNDYVFLVKNVQPVPVDKSFVQLLNGKDFTGWYTFVDSKGKNNDPDHIFTMEPGGVLHDTGKEVGYLMTEKSFDNYHLKLQFKWGEKRWPPRDTVKRDSGICYNVPADEPDHVWPQSIECQIQEGDVGDFWLVGYSTIQVDGKQNSPTRSRRITKPKDAERPTGEWNTVEVISFNGKCVHVVNGVVVNYGENASLVGGKILLQSEYAEVYYREVWLREL